MILFLSALSSGMLLHQVTVVFNLKYHVFQLYHRYSQIKGLDWFYENSSFLLNIIFSSWFDLPLYIISTMIFFIWKKLFIWNMVCYVVFFPRSYVFLNICFCHKRGSITLIIKNSSILTYDRINFGTIWARGTIWDQL